MYPPLRGVARWIERLPQLDPVSGSVQRLVKRLVPDASTRKDLLSGTWLGHPFHPLLTDIVLGAWTSAWFLDLLPSRSAHRAADTLIGIGVLSALPTAAAGLSDWSDLGGGPRRVGAVHAIGNLSALSIYSAAYLARKRGRRVRGWLLAQAGAGVATGAAYLGGHLVYGTGTGVDQTVFERRPRTWSRALGLERLPEGRLTSAAAGGAGVVLYREGPRIHALSNRCPHRGCSLAAGTVEDDAVVCPCHGSTFRLDGGALLRGPATGPAPAYETRVTDGVVEVREAR